jgi:hypothetical protein
LIRWVKRNSNIFIAELKMEKCKYVACAAILLGLGCSSETSTAEGPTVLMVGAFSRTGVSAVSTWGNALNLAADDATEGLAEANNEKLKLINFVADSSRDTLNDQAVTLAIAEETLAQGAKLFVVGTSGDAAALGKLAYDSSSDNDLNVPIVCVACSSPGLHNPTATNPLPEIQGANRNTEKWMFGLAMSSLPQSRVLWNILKDKTETGEPGDLNGDGVVKISTIALDDAFGTGFQNAMQSVVAAESPDAIYEALRHAKDANPDTYDWATALNELTDDKTGATTDVAPDVIIEFTFPQFSLALVKAYDGEIPFLHTHSMREAPVILAADGKLDGQEGTSYLPADGISGTQFNNRFSQAEGVARQSQWDSHVYDGGILFALATVKATLDMADPSEVTGEAIRDAMQTLNVKGGIPIRIGPTEFAKAVEAIAEGEDIDYEGASGPCDFDEYGRALNRISHWSVNAGVPKDDAVYDCVADASCPKKP